MKVRFTHAAEADIAQINREGLRLFGPQQAQAYADGLAQAFRLIGAFPHASPERDYMRRPVRVRAYGSHVILYLILDEYVLVVRIRHGREEWQED